MTYKQKGFPMHSTKSVLKQDFRPSEDEAKRIKTELSKGAGGGTEFVKGARSKGGPTSEKGKRTTYIKQDDDTYSKKVEKIKKGETDKEWETKKDKTISAKKAERQIKRKTKKAARSGKRADIKEVRKAYKPYLKDEGYDKKEVKAERKARVKAIRNR